VEQPVAHQITEVNQMRLLLELSAPAWDQPAGSVMAERNRTMALSRALIDLAMTLQNTGGREGRIIRDHLKGNYLISYQE
jgi:hypothetical protein